ncbi:WD40-repeat-containing domain protein [Paraphysoderma sedebokerense]|nr:WD40-repeat-containing domain protein [Paraphysoderma sedebokerense]
MKAKVLQIHWHSTQAVYSADFDPLNSGRLATAGADNAIRIWKIVTDMTNVNPPTVQFLASLERHTRAVNVVRFSPAGDVLASAGDDGDIILWQPPAHDPGYGKPRQVSAFEKALNENADIEVESWKMKSIIKGSRDIYDLAWSPCGRYIITGSIDNAATVWDVESRKAIRKLESHKHFVQGVAWDPLGQYIATQSSDRSVHIYRVNVQSDNITIHPLNKVNKMEIPKCLQSVQNVTPPDSPPREILQDTILMPPPALPCQKSDKNKLNMMLYHDDTLPSFFRRLSFTPDGSLLLTPAGRYKTVQLKSSSQSPFSAIETPFAKVNEDSKPTVHFFARNTLNRFVCTLEAFMLRQLIFFGRRNPLGHFPCHKKPATIVKVSPVFYKHQSDDDISMGFKLSYRMLIAIGTTDSVIIYDTKQFNPIVYLTGVHYASITDLAWSRDGRILFVTSCDAFCSMISFEKNELGEPVEWNQLPIAIRSRAVYNSMNPTQSSSNITVSTVNDSEMVNDGTTSDSIKHVNTASNTDMSASAINDGKRVEGKPATTAELGAGDDGKKKKKRITPMLVSTV